MTSAMKRGRPIVAYLWAPALIAVAIFIRAVLDQVMADRAPYPLFIVAVLCTYLAGGLGPGILATILGAVGVVYFVVPPVHSFDFEHIGDLWGVGSYVAACFVTLVLVDRQRRARDSAELSAAIAEERRVALDAEVHRRTKAEAEANAQRERFEVTLASIGDGVIATDTDGRVTYMNATAGKLTGWSKQDAIGNDVETVFVIRNEETGAKVENPALHAMRDGRIVGLANHTVLIGREGERLAIDDSGAPIIDSSGIVRGAVLVFRDVTEQKARDAELRTRDRIINASHDAVIVADAERRIKSWNHGAQELYGWTEAEVRGTVIHELLKTRNSVEMRQVDEILQKQGSWDGELSHTCKDGRRILTESRHVLLRGAEGEIQGILEINRDITERRSAQQAVRESEERLRLAMQVGRAFAFEWNPGADGVYRSANCGEILGISGDATRGAGEALFARVHPDDRLRFIETVRSRTPADASYEIEYRIVRDDGSIAVVNESARAVFDEQGKILRVIGMTADVTARAAAEEQLRKTTAEAEEARRTLYALLENIPEGITIADAPDARIRMVSRYGAQLAGRPIESLAGLPASEQSSAWGIYHTDAKTIARGEELPLTRAVVSGDTTIDEEWIIKRPDGSLVPILCNAAPIRDSEGVITGGLIAWRDISQRRQLEEKLREAAKLESIGLLAGGIAHDFNNLLTGILGNASLLLDVIPEGDDQRWSVEGIQHAAERAAKLTQQLLAYSGRGRFVIERLDLSKHIREITALIQASIPKNVELRLELADDMPPVEADAAQIQQLVMNLVVNGAEAVGPKPGRVIVTTKVQEIDRAYIHTMRIEQDVKPGLYAAIVVEDTGCGMDAATLSRIFDPFFSTKFTGRGLGLAAVQGIVRGHKGAIKVYSTPGAGTTFRILLPIAAGYAVVSNEAPRTEAIRGGAGTVLVVDDEEIVRATARLALEKLGYDVLLATDGQAAIDTLRAGHDGICLIVLDMTMPGLSGEATLEELQRIDPNIPVLLSTGFSEMEAMKRFAGRGVSAFLQKPYTVRSLAQKVAAARAAAG